MHTVNITGFWKKINSHYYESLTTFWQLSHYGYFVILCSIPIRCSFFWFGKYFFNVDLPLQMIIGSWAVNIYESCYGIVMCSPAACAAGRRQKEETCRNQEAEVGLLWHCSLDGRDKTDSSFGGL